MEVSIALHALSNGFAETGLSWFIVYWTVLSISAQTSQEGIKCTTAKEWPRSYCPNIYIYSGQNYRYVSKLNHKFIMPYLIKE